MVGAIPPKVQEAQPVAVEGPSVLVAGVAQLVAEEALWAAGAAR